MIADLKARADRLRELHHADEMLVLPNVWDAASAKIVAEAGFPVVATASAAISAMLGYPDGEGAPWQEMFAAAGRVARAVAVPVTVDAEAGYGMEPRELVGRLLEIGAVGCNLEDTDHRAGGLVDADAHAERLAAIRAAAGLPSHCSHALRPPPRPRSRMPIVADTRCLSHERTEYSLWTAITSWTILDLAAPNGGSRATVVTSDCHQT